MITLICSRRIVSAIWAREDEALEDEEAMVMQRAR